jgi:hypothetical protein
MNLQNIYELDLAVEIVHRLCKPSRLRDGQPAPQSIRRRGLGGLWQQLGQQARPHQHHA